MTEKEYAEILRSEEEIEEKRKKLKILAQQHRSSEQQTSDIEEAIFLNQELDNLKIRKAEYIQPKKEVMNMSNYDKIEKEENNVIDRKMVRTVFAKLVRNESITPKERDMYERSIGLKRSFNLGDAVTTTSNDFLLASDTVVGVNNGGIFIPETVLLDILQEDIMFSPILSDVATQAIRGMVKYPYLISKTPALNKKEKEEPTVAKNIEWGILSGKTGNLTTSIIITFEALAQTIEIFTEYLIGLIRESISELLLYDYIYGTGIDDKVLGITNGAIVSTYAPTDSVQSALEAGIKLLPVTKRNGAKIYLSTDLHDQLIFAKDSNGDYIRPVFTGVTNNVFGVNQFFHDPALAKGDFLIGNISKFYKANLIKPLELNFDVSNKHRYREYTAHMMVNAIPVPDSFVHGKKA